MTRRLCAWVPLLLVLACRQSVFTDCSPAPSIGGSPNTFVTAGHDYSGCVNAVSVGSWMLPYPTDDIVLTAGPESASVSGSCVLWHAPDAGTGSKVHFAVATPEDLCGDRARKSWDVSIVAPPSLLRVDLDRDRVSPGTVVTVTAEFTDGTGAVRVGNGRVEPISSGTPMMLGAMLDSVDLAATVTNAAGDKVIVTRRVTVVPDPQISSLAAEPVTITAGAVSMLSWATTSATRVTLAPVGDVSAAGATPVSPTVDTNYVLQAWNELGVSSTARVTVYVVAPPRILSFVASPPEVALGAATTLTPVFENGTAVVEHYLTSWDVAGLIPDEILAPVSSGAALVTPPQQGSDTYRLAVTNQTGARVTADVVVNATGPGTFQSAPTAPRDLGAGPALVRLAAGKVLVVRPSSADTLDPASWTWSGSIALTTRHAWGSAAILSDGAVLVAGGYAPRWPPGVAPFAQAEVVNLASSTSTPVGPTVDGAVSRPSIVPLDGGDALVLGFEGPLRYEGGSAILSPIVAAGGPGPSARACRLADGRVLVVGADAAWFYDAASNAFVPTVSPLAYREVPVMACLRDGSALVGGGTGKSGDRVTTIERFDAVAGSFTSRLWDPLLRRAIELRDGRVLLLGSNAHVYDVASGSITPVGRPISFWSSFMAGPDAVILDDGRVLVVVDGTAWPEIFTP